MTTFSLALFGTFHATRDGAPVTELGSAKARALLAYLAVESDLPHRRTVLAALLWPEHPESDARANLSQALFALRRALGERAVREQAAEGLHTPLIHITAETIQLDPSARSTTDVYRFASLLDECAQHSHARLQACVPCIERLQQAVALYRGRFLEDLSVRNSVPFEEWALAKQEQLHRQAMQALRDLAEALAGRGEYDRALPYARRQVEMDSWREDAHRQVMGLLAATGRRSEALLQYEFCCRSLAELAVEPAAETTRLYEEIRRGAVTAAPAAAVATPLWQLPPALAVAGSLVGSPKQLFVARERELAQLDQLLQQALAGQGRVGFVVGEPGSGKTMLLREFARRAMEAHPALLVAGGGCNAYSGLGDPYLPFVEIMRLLTGDVEAQCAAGSLGREAAWRLQGAAPEMLQAVLQDGPALIHVLFPGATLLAAAQRLPDAADWQTRVQEALDRRSTAPTQAFLYDQATHLLQSLANRHPLLLVLDDLQWADTASISLLFHLARRLAGQRILVLGAYRPEEVAAGREGQPHPLAPAVLELGALWEENQIDLAQAEGRAFVNALVDCQPNRLETAFREALYRHTGGHALFTVELLRGLEQHGDLVRDAGGRWTEGSALDWSRLPKRVEAVIAARIGRLSPQERDWLAVASIEGEEFTVEVIARVRAVDVNEVIHALSGKLARDYRLVVAQGMQWCEGQRLSRYRFRHSLYSSFLYEQMDGVERAHLHGRVGEAIEALYAARAEEMASALANHFEQTGRSDKAIMYLRQAALHATRLADYETSMTCYHRALALVPGLRGREERWQAELDLWRSLLTPLHYAKGAGCAEMDQAVSHLEQLAEDVGTPTDRVDALGWRVGFHYSRAEHSERRPVAEKLLAAAQELQDPLYLGLAEAQVASCLFHLGNFREARAHCERVIDAYDTQRQASVMYLCEGMGVVAVSIAAWALWGLGYPDQALERAQQAIVLGQELNNPVYLGRALQHGILVLHQLRRETGRLREHLAWLSRITSEAHLTMYDADMAIFKGHALIDEGRVSDGIAQMVQGLAKLQDGEQPMMSHFLGMQAEGYARDGQIQRGLETVQKALDWVKKTGEKYYEAELYRIKGNLLSHERTKERAHRIAVASEAEACYLQAIAVARRQEAKSWELRATTSLARLLHSQGHTAEARDRLGAIYAWFTEGFATPDLRDAKALLDEWK